MFKTERMKKVVVAGAKSQLVPVIQTLQRLRALHIEEHQPDDYFSYGDPLPEGERVAEARLIARGLVKSLGLEDHPVKDPRPQISSWNEAVETVEQVERAVTDLLTKRDATRSELRAHEQEATRLKRLSGLGLQVEQFSGYQNLEVLLGTTTSDPESALQDALAQHLIAKAPEDAGFLVAVYVRKRDLEAAENVLAQHGFSPIEPPQGHGGVDSASGRAMTQARRVRIELDEIEAQLESAKNSHGPSLLAAEATLAAAAERANAPLRFATSTNGFVVTGFVPHRRVDETDRALQEATSQSLYIEWQDPLEPGHAHASHTDEASGPAGHVAVPATPSLFAHKRKGPRSFTHMLTLHSVPKYKEIDPTVLMYLTFPLFFAIMIGDLGFGILIMLVALYLKNHYPLGMGGPKVSRMLLLAGLWTTLFGIFIYQEAFGMHFVQAAGKISWEWVLGANWGVYESAAGLAPSAVIYTIGGRTIETIYLSKLGNVEILLGISIGLALLHLNLAIAIGIYNHWILHGAKHAILNRASWLIMQLGVAGIVWGIHAADPLFKGAGWGLLALSIIMIIGGEGVIGALELPKLFSNALSYFRLAAVAMSKAGMALAVNTFAFVQVTDTSWAIAGVGGVLIFIVGHTIILALGIIAGGLHSMRLQLVEFFGWFFEGGGRPFKAFGDPRLLP